MREPCVLSALGFCPRLSRVCGPGMWLQLDKPGSELLAVGVCVSVCLCAAARSPSFCEPERESRDVECGSCGGGAYPSGVSLACVMSTRPSYRNIDLELP